MIPSRTTRRITALTIALLVCSPSLCSRGHAGFQVWKIPVALERAPSASLSLFSKSGICTEQIVEGGTVPGPDCPPDLSLAVAHLQASEAQVLTYDEDTHELRPPRMDLNRIVLQKVKEGRVEQSLSIL